MDDTHKCYNVQCISIRFLCILQMEIMALHITQT